MTHLGDLDGNEMSVSIPADDDGYTGRECPREECLGYFKITFGTGLPDSTTCFCPYCGATEEHDHFWTQDQLKYAESVAMREVMGALHKDLQAMEFEIKPPRNSMFGIGMSLKVEPHRPLPLHQYAESRLETHVECAGCSLKYAIYGVFGFCPDCGVHNSRDILEANLALVEKMLALADEQDDGPIREKLVENALEDCVSAFDGWGRAACAAFDGRATDPARARSVSFQNLKRARTRVNELFAYDLESPLAPGEFDAAHTVFQKRHVLAHCMGVVDQAYLDSTGDQGATIRRKVPFGVAEILAVTAVLRKTAMGLVDHLEARP